MRKSVLLVLLISSILALNFLSCKKVETIPEGNLNLVKLENLNSIPTDYGSLVSVTVNPAFPKVFQLWFEDKDGTIRIVTIAPLEKAIFKDVIMIPRS